MGFQIKLAIPQTQMMPIVRRNSKMHSRYLRVTGIAVLNGFYLIYD